MLRINIQRMTEVQFSVGFHKLFTWGSEFCMSSDGKSKSPELPSWTGSLWRICFWHKLLQNWSLKDGNIRSPDPLKRVQNKMNRRDIAERLVLEVSRNTNLKSYEKKDACNRSCTIVIFWHCGIMCTPRTQLIFLLLCKHLKKIVHILHLPVRTEKDE